MDEIAMLGEVRDGATKRRSRPKTGKSTHIIEIPNLPWLAGIKCGRNQIAVWCPYCRDYHFHGWNHLDKDCITTHRRAHCTDSASPFKKEGYLITVLPKVRGCMIGQIPKKSGKGR